MYRYDEFDAQFVAERVAQFRGQVARRLSGELTEDQFKPLRLMNGLYLQLHAYMLRVAVPYGTLSAAQMRMLAHIARKYDKGYGHFTTRQNIQYNWPKLVDVPDILADLASVEMHCIQTSGNSVRNADCAAISRSFAMTSGATCSRETACGCHAAICNVMSRTSCLNSSLPVVSGLPAPTSASTPTFAPVWMYAATSPLPETSMR